jgi:F0F1-type ATP synthase membrane subunit b/b'
VLQNYKLRDTIVSRIKQETKMELKEFVKTAITDITEAVSELQSELGNGAIVNPALPHSISNGSVDVVSGNQPIQKMEFDGA